MAKEWKGEYYETNRKSREVGWVQANKLPIGGFGHFLVQHNREVSQVQSCSLEEFHL